MPPRSFTLIALATALLFTALSGPLAAAVPGTLLELGKLEQEPVRVLSTEFAAKLQQDLGSRAADFATFGPKAVFQQMLQEHLTGSVRSRGVKYASVDSHGHPRTYSGRVFLPDRAAGTPPAQVPLVIYQHGTETRRTFTSYYGKGDETLFGALGAALCGFAVAMPDGDGMGADPSPEKHAYCQGKTTATCLIDLIRAVQGDVGGQRIFDEDNYVWDGRLFIVGYSEGGYIALAAVQELATNPAYRDLRLTGAACMGGPFDFAKATRELLAEARTPYSRPYIPAYFVAAWEELYPGEVSLQAALNPKLLASVPGQGNISQWLEGTLGGNEITPLIQARITGNKEEAVPARSLMNEAWLKAHVETPSSRLNQLLDANSLVGAWAPPPTLPVLLAHDPYDDTVGFGNTQALFDSWTRHGANPLGIIRLAAGTRGTGHVGGAIVSIPSAFIWIDAGMPRSLMAMAGSRIKEAILANTPESLAEGMEVATAMALEDRDQNRALLPLSKIQVGPGAGNRPYNVSFDDKLWLTGKVKFYTISRTPLYPRQPITPGTGGYTRFAGQIKKMSDTLSINPNTVYYMAVYPEKFTVALTLKFAGASPGGKTFTVNIKQLKNKLVGRRSPALFNISSDFKPHINQATYEAMPEALKVEKPFITLP